MYSQNSEEQIIKDYFGDHTGAILEIGAFDGKSFSNTLALLELGWSGIFIEADPHNFVQLKNNLAPFKTRCICCAVGKERGLFTWYDSGGDAVGSTSKEHADKWSSVIKFNSQNMVVQVTIDDIIAACGNEFDLINIDIEGGSADLFFESFAKFPTTKLWVIEHDGRDKEIATLAAEHGMKVLCTNAENIIIAK